VFQDGSPVRASLDNLWQSQLASLQASRKSHRALQKQSRVKSRTVEVMSSNLETSPQTWVTDSRFPLSDFRYFNSPFEVLFNFPSRYLFAIDLSLIFSHGWRLPPNLRSTPKERDSSNLDRTEASLHKDGTITLCGAPFQAT
jgi:hypothetical protein